MSDAAITGRCCWRQTSLIAARSPIGVAFCHCNNCRRWTGCPAPAFGAFASEALQANPALREPVITTPGLVRWNRTKCDSPLAATFDYMLNQIYVSLGLSDQADQLPAQIHCHSEQQLNWLHIQDDAIRGTGPPREKLLGKAK